MAGPDTKLTEIGSVSSPTGGEMYIVIGGISYRISYSNLTQILMQTLLYDPTGVEGDAFNSANHAFTGSGILAENVQAAIIEVNSKVKQVISNSEVVLESENPKFITFPSGKTIAGSNYEHKIWGYDADGYPVNVKRGAKQANGFFVSVDLDCTVGYHAIEK